MTVASSAPGAVPVTPLTERTSQQKRRQHLVFTSAGDHSNITAWLDDSRNFDLCIAYYGNKPGRYADLAEYYFTRKDSKFGNLKFAWQQWPEMLAPYQSILVQDDDVLISSQKINRLFRIQRELDLWLLQAAFSPLGKISWPITRVQWASRLRYTNFVEITAPLFRKDKLEKFLAEFDPILTGTGTDWWYMHSLGDDCRGNVAIIDEVTCINPHDRSKGGQRECDRLQAETARTAAWEWASSHYDIPRRANIEFERQLKPIPARWISPIVCWPLDGCAFLRKQAVAARNALRDFFRAS
jgi:hypothetical protein